MEIYLVRHGETEANKEGRYRGWTETHLTPKGKCQAEKVAEVMASIELNKLYCSDLMRARETARTIGYKCGLEPIVSPQLREVSFGQWEGLTYREIKEGWEEELYQWYADPFSRSAPEGEKLPVVYRRFQVFLGELLESCSSHHQVALVSHGGILRTCLFYLLNMEPGQFWNIKVENGSLSLLRSEREALRVVYHNRVDHL